MARAHALFQALAANVVNLIRPRRESRNDPDQGLAFGIGTRRGVGRLHRRVPLENDAHVVQRGAALVVDEHGEGGLLTDAATGRPGDRH